VAAGTARITATTTDGGFQAYCDLTVTSGGISGGGDGTYNVATAGTLAALVGAANKSTLTSLTLTGKLNGDDIRFIRDLIRNFNLTSLDMSGAAIVAGGGDYYVPQSGDYYTSTLVNYTYPNEIGDYMFMYLENLQTLIFPSGITSIGEQAVAGATRLRSITIPNGVIGMGYAAFGGCESLTSVTLGSGLEYIDEWAFRFCSHLADVYVMSATPPVLVKEPFRDTPSTKRLHVPYGRWSAYQSSAWGSYFTAANIIEE
jgi:hypothetical protein